MNIILNWKLFLRRLLPFAFILVACSVVSAQEHPKDHKAKFWISTGIYAGGVFSDIYSSRGMREGNPLLRNSKGELNVPRTIGLAIVPYAITLWLDHKHHSRAANIIRLTAGSFHYSVAMRNVRMR